MDAKMDANQEKIDAKIHTNQERLKSKCRPREKKTDANLNEMANPLV
jgi:hypothetical protein